jgi:peptide/nickel transport system permease protein
MRRMTEKRMLNAQTRFLPAPVRVMVVTALKLVTTLLVLSVVVFVIAAAPGDPARAFLGPPATAPEIAAFRSENGLDEPLPTRYVEWLDGVLHGDLGRAYVSGTPVWSLLRPRLSRTLPLVGFAWLLMALVGVSFGLVSGLRSGGRLDSAVSFVSLIFVAVPEFVIGIFLLALFAVKLHWLPANSSAAGLADSPFHALSAYVLPACAVAAAGSVHTLRLTRANAREVAAEPYIRAAVLRGLPPGVVTVRHVLPNAAPPVVGALALRLAGLIGGTVVAENVFGFPGVGQLLVDSAQTGNAPIVEAIALIIGGGYVAINLLADAIVFALTPSRRSIAA